MKKKTIKNFISTLEREYGVDGACGKKITKGQIRAWADACENVENAFFEIGLDTVVKQIIKSTKKKPNKAEIRKELKAIASYLRLEYEDFKDSCGEDDTVNTLPAKKAYQKVKALIVNLR